MALRHFFSLTFAIVTFTFTLSAQTRELPRYLQHTVRDRETPSSIANDYNLRLKTFLMLNNFPDDVKLKPGQVVLIRELEPWEKQIREKGYKSKDADEDQPAPTRKTETAVAPAAEKSNHPTPAAGGLYEKSGGDTHIVKKGQTFYRIALTYGLTVDQLRKLNNMPNTNITIGQELKIR